MNEANRREFLQAAAAGLAMAGAGWPVLARPLACTEVGPSRPSRAKGRA